MIIRKIALLPFSLVYGCIMAIRNLLYDTGVFKSYEIPGKSIVIGNLSVGGTGKSPHTMLLWKLLKDEHSVAILSRGYGRKTKGLLGVEENMLSSQVGDEPLMFKKKVASESTVVVAEKRKVGVDYLRKVSEKSVILLDDAYQHRKVTGGYSILLTDFSSPYFNDAVIPAGTLREWSCGRKRANCLIVTKCPTALSNLEKDKLIQRLKFNPKDVFFSSIIYGDLIVFGKKVNAIKKVLLVTGIAQPKPLLTYLEQFYSIQSMTFPDHHDFTREDIAKIHTKFDTFASEDAIIVTTEKDFVRLESLLSNEDKQNYPWYYQAITVKIDREEEFKTRINSYVNSI